MIDFAMQDCTASLKDAIRARKREADERTYTDYALHLIVTDVADQWLGQLPDVLALGVPTLKAFTAYPNEGLMLSPTELRRLMERAAEVGAQVDVHAEDGPTIEAHRAALEAGLGNPALVTVSEEMVERGEIFVTFNSEQYIPLPFMTPLFYSIVEAAPEFTPVLSLVEVSDALLLDLAQIESDGVRH